MNGRDWVTQQFEESRPFLRGVAYRMLGSLSEADDAVQEAWLRLERTDTASVDNLGGWLRTVVARVCLDMLRSRKSQREEPMGSDVAERAVAHGAGADPEAEAALADATGIALLVVLETLSPVERLAFVLHDVFAMPFEEIGAILERSPDAAKQLASRARRRVRGTPASSEADRTRQRALVDAFLTAARTGDLEGLLAVLDPDAVIHIDPETRKNDPGATNPGRPREVRGAATWAPVLLAMSRGMRSVGVVGPALVDGSVGVLVAPGGKLTRALLFSFDGDRITRLDVVGDPARLGELAIVVL